MNNDVTSFQSLPWYQRADWVNLIFFCATPILALVWVPIYLYHYGWNWWLLAIFFVNSTLAGIGITGGYHRLFAHLSYEARPWVKVFFLLFGAGAFQGSALKWATDHRRHHRSEDTMDDPYGINRGFLFAHFGWIVMKDDPRFKDEVSPDLAADPLVVWQDRYYTPIAITMCFLFPLGLGALAGVPVGGFLFGGLVRMVVLHHRTFFINSFCHMFGSRPYSEKTSATDSFVLAIVTHGEGYHNFHHRFQGDYRNGVRWYHWDPTKWLVKLLSYVGATYRLKITPQWEIIKARIRMEQERLLQKGVPKESMQAISEKIDQAQFRLRALFREYEQLKENMHATSRRKIRVMKAELKSAQNEFRAACEQWVLYRRGLQLDF